MILQQNRSFRVNEWPLSIERIWKETPFWHKARSICAIIIC